MVFREKKMEIAKVVKEIFGSPFTLSVIVLEQEALSPAFEL